MKILVIGAGGVGAAILKIAQTRKFYQQIVVADHNQTIAENIVAELNDSRFTSVKVNAGSAADIVDICRQCEITHIVNAIEPKYIPTIFSAAFTAGANYLDLSVSLSEASQEDPFHEVGIKLADAQFAVADQWQRAGKLALIGVSSTPGLTNILARYAHDHLFGEIDEVAVKTGNNLNVSGFTPLTSNWAAIEEGLNPPLLWTADRGYFTTGLFSEPEIFDFPEGIGSVECVNIEHAEVAMLPRAIEAKRVSYKSGLSRETITTLQMFQQLGLDRTKPVRVRSLQGPVDVSPRDLVSAVLPNPASIGASVTGISCVGVLVTGRDNDGRERATLLYNVVDNQWSIANYQSQAVLWQAAFTPVIALELLAEGMWQGAGVLGPESFDAKPFLDLMSASTGYQLEWKTQERLSAAPLRHP